LKRLLAGTPLEQAGELFLNAVTTLDAEIHGRRLAEGAIRMLIARHGLGGGGRNLFELLGLLTARGLLSERAGIYLHAIRRLGNAAAHDVHVTHRTADGVEAVDWMLLMILREVIEQKAITPRG
jgi:hypothetical protein